MSKPKIKKGQRYGRWTVLEVRTGDSHVTCQCDCGAIKEVYRPNLLNDKTRSCGCLSREVAKENIVDIERIQEQYSYDGTRIDKIKNIESKQKNNTSGVRGVSFMKNKGKYRAYINLRGKQKHLGIFEALGEAKEARKAAEEKYFTPLIKEWEERQKK